MKIVLGSKSPRRKELLEQLGYEFEIRTKETDESYPLNLAPKDVATFIANKKASELVDTLKEGEVLICADTIVVLGKRILGKPNSSAQAFEMLSSLSGNEHEVITGISIVSTTKKIDFAVNTKVLFNELSTETINHYIEAFKPFDKAGSYGIQEFIGAVGIKRIVGSYNNVVGLPTSELYETLKSFDQS